MSPNRLASPRWGAKPVNTQALRGKPVPKGEVSPANDKSLHFGKGQTETDLTLPPGDHTLTLQFGDGAHQSYGPDMSKTITVHVK